MRHIHLALVLLVCSFITLSLTKSTVVYRRYHRKRPALRKTHKNVIEIMEVFKTNRKPPAFIKSDKSIDNFLMCDAKCERKRFLKRRKMCLRTGRYCPTRPSRPKIPTTTQINVSTRPIYNKPTVYDRNPYGNRNPDYTHLYPWSRPSVTVTKYPPDGSKNFNMTILEVNNDTIATTVKDDYEYYDIDNDDRQQHRRSTTFRVPTNHELSTTIKTFESTTYIPSTTVTDVLSQYPITTSTDIIPSSSEYFSTTTETSTFTIPSAATEPYSEIPLVELSTLKTFTTPTTDTSSSTQKSPDEYWTIVVQPELVDGTTTEYFITSTSTQKYAPKTAFPDIETSTTTERSTTEALTTEASTTEASTTEALTTEASTTKTTTTEALTTEASTTEASTTEASTTEITTTEALRTEASTTEITTTETTTTEIATTESTTSTTEELTTPSTTSITTTEIPTTTQSPVVTSSASSTLKSSIDETTSATEVSSTNLEVHTDEDDYTEDYEEGDEEVVDEEGEEGVEEAGEDGEGENGEGEGAAYDYDDDGNYDDEE